MDRGYITIADIVYLLAALAVLAVLTPVFMQLLDAQAGNLTRGQELLLLGVIPTALLVMLTLYFGKAVSGGT